MKAIVAALMFVMFSAQACDNRPVKPLDEEDASQTGTSSGTPTQPPADASPSDGPAVITDV